MFWKVFSVCFLITFMWLAIFEKLQIKSFDQLFAMICALLIVITVGMFKDRRG